MTTPPPPLNPTLLASPTITDFGRMTSADWQRIADDQLIAAETLINAASPCPNEALYLAGFALEVALKGKICLEGLSIGAKTHNLADLLYRSQILRAARATPVSAAARANVPFLATAGATYSYWQLFSYIYGKWDNQIRYNVGSNSVADSQEFVAAVKEMVAWIWTA